MPPSIDVIQYFTKSELLNGVSEEELRALRPAPELISLAAGETLIRQGDPGQDYSLLVYGRLLVFVETGGVERPWARFTPAKASGKWPC